MYLKKEQFEQKYFTVKLFVYFKHNTISLQIISIKFRLTHLFFEALQMATCWDFTLILQCNEDNFETKEYLPKEYLAQNFVGCSKPNFK
jgi:hypothetical protein